jgi:hypothetical protein
MFKINKIINRDRMKEIKSFVLRKPAETETSVFTGYQPGQAALKAANRIGGTKDKPVEIRLRERRTKKVHISMGGKNSLQLQRINLPRCRIRLTSRLLKSLELRK